ncbi:hypothetical protein Lalb_Chr04g0254271 [Lupinus albus]|uniref:Uncharacterized protein n=1 Tax=Lupinus albus TaxID=3870 RepID=A0A6A4QPB2_LUPAL|nr:hypothetical protein Lalb_Chr04g0254271 [Lupinus albus]
MWVVVVMQIGVMMNLVDQFSVVTKGAFTFFSCSSLARSTLNCVSNYPICLFLLYYLRSGILLNLVKHSPLFHAPPLPSYLSQSTYFSLGFHGLYYSL